MSKILVSGSVAYDRIVDFDGIFPEPFDPDKLKYVLDDVPAESLKETYGGNAANIAYSLALLGERPAIIAVVGNDFEPYRLRMEQSGIDTASIQILTDLPTANALIMTDKHDQQVVRFSEEALARRYEKKLDPNAALMMCGPTQMDDMVSLPRACSEMGIPYYADPGQRTVRLDNADLRKIISGARALFVNEVELRLVVEKTGWDEAALVRHVPVVVATRAEKGSRILTQNEELHITAAPARAVDPTGAGDAHRAGFIKGVLSGLDLKVCGQLASTVAAYAVEVHGTQNHHFTMDELRGRYEKAYGQKLPL